MAASRFKLDPLKIRWIEEADPENGHGVQFRHDDISDQCIAFLEGFGWQDGGAAIVRVLAVRPRSVEVERWPAIVQNSMDAVVAFLSAKDFPGNFRLGPVRAMFNG